MDPIESIKQLKARYFRMLDSKDWVGMRRVLSDDVVVDTTASGGEVTTGADDFIEILQRTLDGAVTVHHGHMPEIQLASATTATGIWALQDTIIWPDGSRLLGFGHYYESYELVEDEWRIKELTLTRLHMEISDPSAETR